MIDNNDVLQREVAMLDTLTDMEVILLLYGILITADSHTFFRSPTLS